MDQRFCCYVLTRPGFFFSISKLACSFNCGTKPVDLISCNSLCEMKYVLHILHYAVINHNKILTRKAIQMQIREHWCIANIEINLTKSTMNLYEYRR